jgi:hypothetical protein
MHEKCGCEWSMGLTVPFVSVQNGICLEDSEEVFLSMGILTKHFVLGELTMEVFPDVIYALWSAILLQ